ncbi:hypothetical protein Q7689_02455 [Nocardiopsis tropica]|uniref:hypothetical protein n=1 Tax=Nocardiopsis tropica TaxID=109330 RepID=UPI002E85DB79|nr:hypothetical protein [Nocardiopsis tropica]
MSNNFQLGGIPHGFAFNENGSLIHYRHVIVLATPGANQAGAGGDVWISFASDFADVRVRLAVHDGTNWSVTNVDVPFGGGRVAQKLRPGAQKISLGQVKKSAADSVEDAPVGWLLEVFGP